MKFYDTIDFLKQTPAFEEYLINSKILIDPALNKRIFFKPVSTSENNTKHKIAFWGINAYSGKDYLLSFDESKSFGVEVEKDYVALKEVISTYEDRLQLAGQSYYTNVIKDVLLHENGFASAIKVWELLKNFPLFRKSIESIVWSEMQTLIFNGCDYFVFLGDLSWTVFELARVNLALASNKMEIKDNGNILVFEFLNRKIYLISEYHFSRPSNRKKEYTNKIISEI